MRCATCAHDNRAERRFCAGCGAALAAACARCGFANLPGERFCGGCGGSVETPAPAGERRQVAILFADLAGYTRLSNTLDPEEVHRLLTGFFDAVDGVCTRFGGSIDKHIGDNVMAIFGAPVAHGDDPERALRAAVEIHRAVAAYSEQVGRALAVHIGVAYGEVIASGLGSAHHQEYTVTGDAVNLAARLQDKAVGGETMISDAVHRAAARIAIAEPVGDVAVKGLAEPVAVWKLLDVRVTATAPIRLVGREDELAAIAARLDQVRRDRRGVLITLRGEAGIGKSTLAAEVARRAGDAGFAVHAAQILDFGQGRGAGAVPSLIASLLGAPDEERRAVVDAALATGAIAAADAPHLASLLEVALDDDSALDDRERRDRQQAVLDQLIAAVPRPLLLIVEDVHWADAATLGWLRRCTAAAGARDGAVLVTSRIDGDPVDPTWRAICASLDVELQPLATAEAARLAADHLVDGDLIDRCVERAGGNPLFLEQLIHSATRDAALPGTLQGVVLARVDRLPARDKAALQAAAIGGQRSSLALVRHLAGDPAWTPDELFARRLLIRPAHQDDDDDELRFQHALILDGVYASLTHARRRELHRAAAGYYAGRAPDLHAEHLERGGDPGAAAAWLAAAVRHAAMHDPTRTPAMIARGLACATTPTDLHALHVLAGQLHLDIGDGPAALPSWRAALDTAGDDLARCRALIGLAGVYRLTTEFDAAEAALAEADPIATRLSLPLEQAQIAYYRGGLAFTRGDLAGCRPHHQRALEHARRAGAAEWEARALSGLGDALYIGGEFAAAATTFEECVRLSESLGLRGFALVNRAMVADSIFYLLRVEETERILHEVVAEARALGARRAEALALESLAISRMQRGHFEGLEALNLEVRAFCEALGMRNFVATTYIVEATMALEAGQLERAAAATRAGRGLGGVAVGFFMWLSLRIATELGPDSSAEQRAAMVAECAPQVVDRSIGGLMFHSNLIDVGLRHGELELVERHSRLLDQHLGDVPFASYLAARARLWCAWGRGDRGPAVHAERVRLRGLAGLMLSLPE